MDSRSIFLPRLAGVITMGGHRRIEESGDGYPDGAVKAGLRRQIHAVIQR
jgi:hypothetical protein